MDGTVDSASASASDVLASPPPVLKHDRVAEYIETTWGLRPNALWPLASERDLNIRVDADYVLKISNPAERIDVVAMEVAAAEHVRRADPGLPVPNTVAARTGETVPHVLDDTGRGCAARLITLLPGRHLEGLPITIGMAEQIGSVCARTSVALSGLFHPAAGREIDWDVRRAAHVLHTQSAALQSLGRVGQQLRDLAPRLAAAALQTESLRGGLQHADVTLTNLLADDGTDQRPHRLRRHALHRGRLRPGGDADLGAAQHRGHRRRPPICGSSLRRSCNGYQRHRLLEPAEVDVLGELVLARLALTLAISARRAASASGQSSTTSVSTTQRTRRVLDAELAARRTRGACRAVAPTLAGHRNRTRCRRATSHLLDRRLARDGRHARAAVLPPAARDRAR